MEEIADLGTAFAKRVLLPKWDSLDAPGAAHLDTVLQAAAAAGLLGFAVPEAAGGSGLGVAEYTVLLEEVSRACAGVGVLLAAHLAGIAPLLLSADDDQRNRILSPVTQAEAAGKAVLFAAAIRECRSPDFFQEDIHTETDRREGGCVLTGVKTHVLAGAAATFFAVLARERGHGGLCWVVVPRDAPGVEVRPERPRLGLRICPANDIAFQHVEVRPENVIPIASPQDRLFSYHSYVDPALASVSVGMAVEAQELAADYAVKRHQGGKMICDHDAVRMMLADMEMLIHASRAMARGAKAGILASAFAAEAAEEVCLNAVQVLGGYGYMADYRIERILRDAKAYRAMIGPRARRLESVRSTVERKR